MGLNKIKMNKRRSFVFIGKDRCAISNSKMQKSQKLDILNSTF
jgi:hypothetical protein